MIPSVPKEKYETEAPSGAPLMQPSTARRIFIFTLGFMVLTQALLLLKIGNGLSPFDTFDEADAVRSGEAYAKEGFTSHHGMPRILYGSRFPKDGAVWDHVDTDGFVKPIYRQSFPEGMSNPNEWVYTHYPPGPDLWSGVLARCFGLDQLWRWRLAPISFAFIAVIIFYRTLSRSFGVDRGALITAACAILPLANTYMPGLHFEGYSYTFLLLQLSAMIKILWGKSRFWHWLILFLLGFVQGWFSFDLFFVVCFSFAPLWLMRRAEGNSSSLRLICFGVGLPLAGFGFAHFLHLLQVAAELGGIRQAITELTHTAVDRVGITVGVDQFSYLKSFKQMSYLYIREFLRLYNQFFGPFMVLAIAAGLLVAGFCRTRLALLPFRKQIQWVIFFSWPGPKKLWLTFMSAFFVCALWPIVMPGANVGNFHIYPRDFFFFYFVLVLAVVKSISFSRNKIFS
jgi:hypothetical protein